MSFNLALSGIITGATLTVCGGYQYLKGSEDKQKLALASIAAGVASFVAGMSLMTSQTSETNPLVLVNETDFCPIVQSLHCPLDDLKRILEENHNDSLIVKTFQVFNNSRGISCEDYLEWPKAGRYWSVQPQDLQQSAMWGLDDERNPFLALKTIYNKTAGALFLRQHGSNFYGFYAIHWGLAPAAFLVKLGKLLGGETVNTIE